MQTQERIREQTHTKPIKFNGVQHNAGSPTNPITKGRQANLLSTNTMGSGGHHEGLAGSAPANTKSTPPKTNNLNVISSNNGVAQAAMNSP